MPGYLKRMRWASLKAVGTLEKSTPCFAKFRASFACAHSNVTPRNLAGTCLIFNTYYQYNENCRSRAWKYFSGGTFPPPESFGERKRTSREAAKARRGFPADFLSPLRPPRPLRETFCPSQKQDGLLSGTNPCACFVFGLAGRRSSDKSVAT